ncbi:hypothetical protein KX729_05720 [Rhizobium sp. XQZ8]|uniref:hypothetical protein n=1 Tax=Rhizobium populisoli TaxID=2859785 RepID=UPI001CA4AFEC|nr:hypothetical protein [Rhizobium populisoli]MBW6420934.1 hypothetical protein [Rhizobium populisoli]
MNIKNTVTLSDRYLRQAERLVENGQFPSIEKVIEAGIDSLMNDDPVPAGPNDPLAGMADEIRRRLATPRDQFIPMDADNMFDRVRARLDEKYKAK